MEYTRPMTKTAAELLGEVNHYIALGQANYARAHAALAEYEKALGMTRTPKVPTIKSLRIWGEWLAKNGPALRGTITGDTGVRLTERATPHTVAWTDQIDPSDEGAYPESTIMRMRAQSKGPGMGAPETIYFLWSQRFDVLPLFGVGPKQDPAVLLGVVHPPTVHYDIPDKEPTEEPDTVQAWIDRHAAIFQQIKLGGKPDAEQRLRMRADAPDGVDANLAIALAASDRLSELVS